MIPPPIIKTLLPTLISAKLIACKLTAEGSTIAASSSLILSGILRTISPRHLIYSLYAPGLVKESPKASVHVERQYCGLPLLQASHLKQGEIGNPVTLCPIFKSFLSPGSKTSPANSCPITNPLGSPLTK